MYICQKVVHPYMIMIIIKSSVFTVAILLLSLHHTEAQIGVCYGTKGNNLPCAQDVVNLYESNNIGSMRIYEPDQDTLQALQGTNIQLMLGVVNDDIPGLASDQSVADDWVQTNVVPYASSIKYIAVGNEIKPTDPQASSVVQAMENILYSLNCNDLGSQIKVSTAVDTSLITNSYPPSHAYFISLSYVTPIINFLLNNDSPLLVNIQPYVAYINDPKNIKLEYALFTACGTVVTDDNGKKYQNLFDAIYDAMYTAINKVVAQISSLNNGNQNGGAIKQVASESGWPSKSGFHHKSIVKDNSRNEQQSRNMVSSKRGRDRNQINDNLGCGVGSISKGGDVANVENARTFYTNLIKHVKKGTPLTPGQEIETYLFAMFDENQKPGDETERHYGLFTPNEQPKYGNLNFC